MMTVRNKGSPVNRQELEVDRKLKMNLNGVWHLWQISKDMAIPAFRQLPLCPIHSHPQETPTRIRLYL